MIEVLSSAALATVQDMGRTGSLRWGVGTAGAMDPRIATPRRKVPVLSIPGGAVSIGGAQTGVSASAGPSGWNTIGCTAMSFFDPSKDPPATLQPGDMIRFRVQGVIR